MALLLTPLLKTKHWCKNIKQLILGLVANCGLTLRLIGMVSFWGVATITLDILILEIYLRMDYTNALIVKDMFF